VVVLDGDGDVVVGDVVVGDGDGDVVVGDGDGDVVVGDGDGDVVVGDADGLVGVGLGVDGFGDADFRTDGLAGRVVTAAGTTTGGEYTLLEGDGEADLAEAVGLAEVGAVEDGAGSAGRS
jgi:hypothetical protein